MLNVAALLNFASLCVKPNHHTNRINIISNQMQICLKRRTPSQYGYILYLCAKSAWKDRHVCWYHVTAYFEDSDHVCRELHESRVGHPPVDPIHEDAGSDSVCNRPELGFLVRLPPSGGQLPGEGGGEPFSHFGWNSVGLHLGQLVVVVR
jgi:hypothetical protein